MLDSVKNTRYAIGHNLGVVEIPEDGGCWNEGRPNYMHNGVHCNHMQAYVIHRHNRGFFILFCFTNDSGQRDFDKHFKAMQQIFRYKDDE